jgi:hypothetical protein
MEHERVLTEAILRAAARGAIVVAAADDDGVRWLPGSLPGVVSVRLDASCPRHEFRVAGGEGAAIFCASGFPREIPGVPPERNLNGISFAVANMSGFAACAREQASAGSIDEIVRLLAVRGRGA